MIKYWKDVDIVDMSKRLEDFVIRMITQQYLMEEEKGERVKA